MHLTLDRISGLGIVVYNGRGHISVTILHENNNIKWENLKKLKSQTIKRDEDMDLYNLVSFYKFFKDLYSEKTLSDETTSRLKDETARRQEDPPAEDIDKILNDEISPEELSRNISKLKKGKASAEDGITNEFIINTANNTRLVILKVFNECLKQGIYPWNTALITPLHKKGNKDDPNNYRAIAVGSNLGKLFSSILLERLINFRSIHCPDTTNQLGFVKEAQTSDHIFTLRTCIEKYTKQKKRLYSCFVDYRKAFDTVCRDALLYKLCNLGIKGNFFNCVKHMYQNSSAKLKLLNKLSEAIDILIGTEQGHPMSPELFKIYLLDLSNDLNETLGLNIPNLNGGYWLGGRTSAADSRESARIRADSARFRADPPDVRQKYFSADSAERPANVRRKPADSARIRADPRGLRGELAEEFTRKMSADKNLPNTTVPRGETSAADVLPPRK